MKLFFSPSACSLSPHIVARELGLDVAIERVDGKTKKTATGRDFLAINPKGYVPVLELDDGEVLTEGPAIVQYLADLKPEAGLAPPAGTMARYHLQEMLGYINSELHKTYSPLFTPTTTPEAREAAGAYLKRRYAFIEARLAAGGPFLFGPQFTVADAYLFVVTAWAAFVKLDLSEFPALIAFQERVAARPAVQAARAAEAAAKAS
ncbi:MAG: glutathione transferase GstA [Kofleriaceae bacterium]|jgi:glutathione S-transferase|nr:glutathione transferase GstA [Kofleriaceae bacterium]MBP6838914.1 glutathione transferase GstA [Kofleriaceae bacterium]MBP9202471.1 glutathione transferase GstA [Kofleriaceae bacterium]